MSEPTRPDLPQPAPATDPSAADVEVAETPSGGIVSQRSFRIGAAVVIVLAVALVVWLAVRDNGSDGGSTGTSAVTAVTPAGLEALAATVGHPVFWLGPKQGTTYELARTSNGSIYVRYLPEGVKLGTKTPYLTVATYPYPAAYEAIQSVSQNSDSKAIKLEGNGLAEAARNAATSVHAAYPDVDYQVEVFDPAAGTAEALVRAGKLAAFGSLTGTPSAPLKPVASSPAKLKALATSLGHPVYWAGPQPGTTYELRQTKSGQVYVRYLPKGVKVGNAGQYLTIGTYPYPGALDAIKTIAKGKNVVALKLEGGGLAVIENGEGRNIHLAFPGVDYQVEVFDPSAAAAKRVVSSGQVTSLG